MKALKTKVILSGIVLVFAFIATIGTTFAWFTISETVAVDGINLQVTSSDNLLIRVDGAADGSVFSYASDDVMLASNYQSSLALTDITGVTKYQDIATWRLDPVTAVNTDYTGVDAKTLSALDDTYVTRNLTVDTGSNSASGGYIEINLWLYSQASDTRPIEVSDISITSSNGDADLDAVANAVRFGIWMEDNGPTVGDAYIFGNDTDFGFEFLVGNAGYSDADLINDLNDTGLNIGTPTTLTSALTDGTGALITTVTGADRVLLIDPVDNDNDKNVFTIEPLTPTLVTVRIYIEGWDEQASNAIVNANFDLSLGFRFGTTTLTFDGNDGTLDSGSLTATLSSIGTGAVTEPTFTHATLAFQGWNTQADGNGDPFVLGTDTITEDTTIYAVWG
ncbi:MAG: InlB B-repeat-containing protein [Tenericutes bacterium]|jgi:hypothetical protein|nr:InlB B-repeat-containing protein [Mycoplasmatota bacterium]